MEHNDKTFTYHFTQCCARSCSRLAYAHRQSNPDYAAAEQDCSALYALIHDKLGAEHRLINQFDAAKNHLYALDNELIYQQGFQDCVTLLRWVGLLQ